jgi:hypothetical protein
MRSDVTFPHIIQPTRPWLRTKPSSWIAVNTSRSEVSCLVQAGDRGGRERISADLKAPNLSLAIYERG